MHHEVREEVRRFVEKHVVAMGGDLRIADIGAYDVNGNLRGLFQRPGWVYTGFDMASGPNVDAVLPSSHEWPNVPTAGFDVVDIRGAIPAPFVRNVALCRLLHRVGNLRRSLFAYNFVVTGVPSPGAHG